MKVKICGMKHAGNITEVSLQEPDFMGFIFYAGSPRFVSLEEIKIALDQKWNGRIKKVGVFVNEPMANLEKIYHEIKLDYAQLHGDETLEYIKELRSIGMKIIKAFRISNDFDWSLSNDFVSDCDFFLFDTASVRYGGSGQKFNWKLLENYKHNRPFFLSGGIEISDIEQIKKLSIPELFGIDANSKLEIKPGLKDVDQVKILINELKR